MGSEGKRQGPMPSGGAGEGGTREGSGIHLGVGKGTRGGEPCGSLAGGAIRAQGTRVDREGEGVEGEGPATPPPHNSVGGEGVEAGVGAGTRGVGVKRGPWNRSPAPTLQMSSPGALPPKRGAPARPFGTLASKHGRRGGGGGHDGGDVPITPTLTVMMEITVLVLTLTTSPSAPRAHRMVEGAGGCCLGATGSHRSRMSSASTSALTCRKSAAPAAWLN